MTTHPYWTSILNKLCVETFSEREDNETFHPPVLGGSMLFQRSRGSEPGFQESQDHRKVLCRGPLEVSPTQSSLLLALDQARYNLVLSYLEISHRLWAACSSFVLPVCHRQDVFVIFAYPFLLVAGCYIANR